MRTHWFESQIAKLVSLSEEYTAHRTVRNDQSATFDHQPDVHRSKLVEALNRIVTKVAAHRGVSGCLISYDGLVMAMAGEASDFDALAAVTQEFVDVANKGINTLELGRMQQIVVVGTNYKIAVVVIGTMALSVLSPRTTNLSASLRDGA